MVNEFPYHSFRWQGIDGSEVLAHMPPEGTYNSSASPKALRAAAGNYAQRGLSKNAMVLYGIGDGGGGPGRQHLETVAREGSVYGVPDVVNATSETFFRELRKETDALPVYKGEIYLEKHQGTYTSQSDNKYYNRKIENALAGYEFAQVVTGSADHAANDRIWKEVLLYQFHDILPGSSIRRVYDESVARYRELLNEVTERTRATYAGSGDALCVCNTTSYLRRETVKAEGKWYFVEAAPYSVTQLTKECKKFSVYSDGRRLGNDLVEAVIADDGTIASVVGKRTGRQALAHPSCSFPVFDDVGDGWDFYFGYRRGGAEYFEKTDARAFTDGARAGVKISYRYHKSVLEETVSVTEGSPLVRVDIRIDWQETEKMLRADIFPAVETDEVTCDIQFGNVRRSMLTNNSLQTAQYEVCAHKWVDMSSLGYGVAVLNDGKYGYACKDGCISVNLLRSQMHPCVDQDKGEHTFSFAIYAHEGDVHHSDVAAQAYAFNRPLTVVRAEPVASLVSADDPHAVIETVKPAEDGNGYVVRLYNDLPAPITTTLRARGTRMTRTDMLERGDEETEGTLTLHGYEIATVRIR